MCPCNNYNTCCGAGDAPTQHDYNIVIIIMLHLYMYSVCIMLCACFPFVLDLPSRDQLARFASANWKMTFWWTAEAQKGGE